VSAIDFSPDGKYVATASLDKTVQVLEITNSKPPAICQQHTDQHKEGVVAVKFSPDGKYIATASLDSTAGLGEIGKDGTISNFKLLPHGSPVVAIDFSPKDGQYLATAGSDGIVQIWDTKNHRQVALLKDNTYVRAVSFSQDGRYLATVSLDNKARVWDWNNHSFDQKYMSLPQKNVVAVAFSPKEGKYLATASADGSVQVWDTTSYKEIARLKDKTYVMAIKFSPDGRYLATVSLDNQVKVWEWEVNRNGQKALSLPQDNVVAVAFSPKDGKYLAMASDDGAAQVWETANAGRVKTVSHDGNSLVDIAFSPTDDQYLVTASADGTIKLTKW
jgi:WD40 repeat protein